jgi:hypothetical protein
MILVIAIWSLIFFIFFVLGFSVIKVLLKVIGKKDRSNIVTLDECFFTGFLTLSALSGVLSIWIPIGNKVLIVVGVLSVILSLVNFREIQNIFHESKNKLIEFKRAEVITIFLFLLFLLAVVVQKITWYDTWLYHAQSIQWIRKFAVIPGLGNIHGRLALNSMFLVISGLFTFHVNNVLIFPLNGICYTVLVLRLFSLLKSEYEQEVKWKAVLWGFIIVISLLFMIPLLNSTSPDIICGILVIYAFILIITKTKEYDQPDYLKTILLSIVVFSCLTYKISSLFLVLTLLLNLKSGFYRKCLIIIATGFIIIIPYIVRNYYLSGYLVYPFPAVDIFNVDWKIPLEKAVSEKSWIVSWARVPGISPDKVLNMKISEWILPWFKSYNFNNKLILTTNLLSVITFMIMLVKKDILYARIQLILLINLLFWFLMAPDPRFAYGFLFMGFALTVAYLVRMIGSAKILNYFKIMLAVILFIILFSNKSIPLGILKEPSLCFVPASFETVKTKELKSDFDYRVPAEEGQDQCFYCDIPCVPYPLVNVKLRGHEIKDGFKVVVENR